MWTGRRRYSHAGEGGGPGWSAQPAREDAGPRGFSPPSGALAPSPCGGGTLGPAALLLLALATKLEALLAELAVQPLDAGARPCQLLAERCFALGRGA